MSCWCGHGSWHHYGYAYPPAGYPPAAPYPPAYYPPAYPESRSPRGRRARAEDLEDYLRDLEDELARVREELAEYRRERGETGIGRRKNEEQGGGFTSRPFQLFGLLMTTG